MKPLLSSSVGLVMMATACLPAMAGGVPVNDAMSILKTLEKLKSDQGDIQVQTQKKETEGLKIATDDQIIAELDQLIAAGNVPQAATKQSVDQLEQGSGDQKASAENLYNAKDTNPAAQKVFGDASKSVEQYIIAGAKETYSQPGVAAAGLSQAQWRALLQALIWQESRFRPFIGSPAGAYGLTQLVKDTAQQMGVNPAYKTDPAAQVRGGGKYLALMLKMFKGNIVFALAGYNAGPGAVQKYHGVPPFKETQNYVVVIPKKYNEYLAKIGGVDAEGTIEPGLAASANLNLTSGSASEYADAMASSIAPIAQRLKNIIQQLKTNENPSQAWVFNTYARAEMARIFALRLRMTAVHAKQQGAIEMAAATDVAVERTFFNFNGSN